MIAYSKEYILNSRLLKKAEYWFAKKLLSAEQLTEIKNRYPSPFYSPALFVKFGLFIFTYVLVGAALSAYSTFLAMGQVDFGKGLGIVTCLLFSVACFIVLELLIREKKLFRSGIDEALLYTGLGFTFGFFGFIFGDVNYFTGENMVLFFCSIAIPILTAALLRYADSLVAFCLALCIYIVYFLLILKLGEIAKMIMPFALMMLSAIIYFFTRRLKSKEELIFWRNGITVFQCIALVIFYAAGNYYVIRESSIEFFDMQLAPGQDIPLAFLFYLLTALVPIFYVYFGLKRKDKTLLWIGLLLIGAAAITFKYYFSLGHPEITLTLAGSVMIIAAYASIKYLKTPKHGITFEEEEDEDSFLKTNAEALIIAQSFSQQAQPQNDPNMGGGDFGGGGAGSKF